MVDNEIGDKLKSIGSLIKQLISIENVTMPLLFIHIKYTYKTFMSYLFHLLCSLKFFNKSNLEDPDRLQSI